MAVLLSFSSLDDARISAARSRRSFKSLTRDASITNSALPCLQIGFSVQIPAGSGEAVTDVSAGRCAFARRRAKNCPHRRRPRRAETSPSSRAAFSRADMATLVSTKVSANSLSQRSVHARSRTGDRPPWLQGSSFPLQVSRARLAVARSGSSERRCSPGDHPVNGRAPACIGSRRGRQ